MRERGAGRDPPCVDATDLVVKGGLGGLVIEIYCRAHALDDECGTQARGLVHRRPFQGHDVDVAQVGGGFLDESDPAVGWDQPMFGGVDADADNEPIGDGAGALSDVKVSVGEGVERAGKQCDHRRSSSLIDEASASSGALTPPSESSVGSGGPAK